MRGHPNDYNIHAVNQVNLTNHFLIAMPSMADPHFSRTLTYICEHSDKGAMGIVVNRPIELNLSGLFERIGLSLESAEVGRSPVYFGGPVQTSHGFVLHKPVGSWNSTLAVQARLGLTSSKDILEAVGRGEGPQQLLVSLGYSGWGAGQLESEIKQNAWLTVEAQDAILFDIPAAERLPAAMGILGVDYALLSDSAGHA